MKVLELPSKRESCSSATWDLTTVHMDSRARLAELKKIDRATNAALSQAIQFYDRQSGWWSCWTRPRWPARPTSANAGRFVTYHLVKSRFGATHVLKMDDSAGCLLPPNCAFPLSSRTIFLNGHTFMISELQDIRKLHVDG